MNLEIVQILNRLSQFSLCSYEIGSVIRSHGLDCASSCYKPSDCINAGVGIQCMCNLQVHSSDVQARKDNSIPLQIGSPPPYFKWAKKVYAYISERWFVR